MQERIGFKDDATREDFFLSVREGSGTNSWKELMRILCLPRTRFQRYKYGEALLSRQVFDSMLKFLPKEEQDAFIEKVIVKSENWGAIKGGKNNYKKNSAEIIKRLRKGFEDHLQPVDISNPLTEKLCEFVGAVIGDGCIDSHVDNKGKSKYHINITGNAELDKDYLTNVIPSIAKDMFNINSYVYFRSDSKTVILNFYSKTLFALLTRRFYFPIGKKTSTIKIPEEILNSNEKCVFAAIRGIFDTDGCVFIDRRKIYNKHYPRITLTIVSEPLFLQLKNFLKDYFTLYTRYYAKRNSHCLEIYGHEQLTKWMQLIGFSNKRHLNKVEKLNEEP